MYSTIPYKYNPSNFHLVATSYYPPPVIQNGLLAGLKFVPMPHSHNNKIKTCLTTYSKYSKNIFHNLADLIQNTSSKSKFDLWKNKFHIFANKMFTSPEWKLLHDNHVLFSADKNMSLYIVHKSWMIEWSRKFLFDPDNYSNQVIS
jgi:hypothetical protein